MALSLLYSGGRLLLMPTNQLQKDPDMETAIGETEKKDLNSKIEELTTKEGCTALHKAEQTSSAQLLASGKPICWSGWEQVFARTPQSTAWQYCSDPVQWRKEAHQQLDRSIVHRKTGRAGKVALVDESWRAAVIFQNDEGIVCEARWREAFATQANL